MKVLEMIRLRTLCRIRGLGIDIRVTGKEYFRGAKEELEVLYRHLEELRWIEADIECAKRYLSEEDYKKFKKISKKLKYRIERQGESK